MMLCVAFGGASVLSNGMAGHTLWLSISLSISGRRETDLDLSPAIFCYVSVCLIFECLFYAVI